jgi:hypothetical protein
MLAAMSCSCMPRHANNPFRPCVYWLVCITRGKGRLLRCFLRMWLQSWSTTISRGTAGVLAAVRGARRPHFVAFVTKLSFLLCVGIVEPAAVLILAERSSLADSHRVWSGTPKALPISAATPVGAEPACGLPFFGSKAASALAARVSLPAHRRGNTRGR